MTLGTVFFTNDYNNKVNNLIEKEMETLIANQKLSANIQERIGLIRGYVLFGEEEYLERFNEVTDESKAIQEQLLTLTNSETEKNLITQSEQWRKYIEDYLLPVVKSDDLALAREVLKDKITPMGRSIDEGLKELATSEEEEIKANGQKLIQEGNSVIVITLLISALAIFSGLAIAYIMANRITKPIVMVSQRMELLADGDLSLPELHTKANDEIGGLVQSLNQLVTNLKMLIGEVSDSTMQVTASSEELTASAEQSTGAAEQISGLAQTAAAGAEQQQISSVEVLASMKELSVGLNQIAQNGNDMNELTSAANTSIKNGSKAVLQVVEQMNDIHGSVEETSAIISRLGGLSTEISNILALITAISEQTNLLALNAAIEAARAGEHGKGFAVVADEVRKLAEGSRQSAVQIASMISEIQNETNKAIESMQIGQAKVSEGIQFSQNVSESFVVIEQTNDGVKEKVLDVSLAIEQMTGVSDRVLTSVLEVSELARNGAEFSQSSSAANQEQLATMEEISASAQSLAHLAEGLQLQVNKFKL